MGRKFAQDRPDRIQNGSGAGRTILQVRDGEHDRGIRVGVPKVVFMCKVMIQAVFGVCVESEIELGPASTLDIIFGLKKCGTLLAVLLVSLTSVV
jgi:hypothetical protein